MRFAAALLLVLAASCDASGATTSSTAASTATTVVATTSTTEVTATALGCGGRPGDYRADGPLGIVGGPDADAQQISSITLTRTGDCERFEVALSTAGGAPATSLPSAEVELIASAGVIRVKFDETVTASAITDSVLEGAFVERAFVVLAADGSIYVDAHLSGVVAARTFLRQNPARIAVEMQTIDGEASGFPKVNESLVVTGPSERVVEYPIVVTGYARTADAQVVATVLQGTGTESEVIVTTADPAQLWGEFTITVDEGPGGDIVVRIGEPPGIELNVSAG